MEPDVLMALTDCDGDVKGGHLANDMKRGPTVRKQPVELDEVAQWHVKHLQCKLSTMKIGESLPWKSSRRARCEAWTGRTLHWDLDCPGIARLGRMCLRWNRSIKFTVVGLEDDVVGLREAHDEDEVDDKESEKVFGDHPIDHDHKGADDLNRPGMISCAGKQGKRNSSKLSEIFVMVIVAFF